MAPDATAGSKSPMMGYFDEEPYQISKWGQNDKNKGKKKQNKKPRSDSQCAFGLGQCAYE